MIGANPYALAAVDAPFVYDMRPPVPHADGFRRAALQTVGAALASRDIQTDGMKPLRLHEKSSSERGKADL
jgi:hypothetical protein